MNDQFSVGKGLTSWVPRNPPKRTILDLADIKNMFPDASKVIYNLMYSPAAQSFSLAMR